jgi:hypothetical protein
MEILEHWEEAAAAAVEHKQLPVVVQVAREHLLVVGQEEVEDQVVQPPMVPMVVRLVELVEQQAVDQEEGLEIQMEVVERKMPPGQVDY